MAPKKNIILDLDIEDDQPVKQTNSRKNSRVTGSKKRQATIRETDEDDEVQTPSVVKRERCNSNIPDEESPKKRKSPKGSSKDEFFGLLAIDFGMSGCGMSGGLQCGQPSQVEARKNWPKSKGVLTSKFPAITALSEDNEGNEYFTGRIDAYNAFEVVKGMKITSFTKTCMPRNVSTSPFDDTIFEQGIAEKLLRPSEPAKKRKGMIQILKYIRKIHKEDLENGFGRGLRPEDNFHYIFTYPAACSEAGKRTLRDAVKTAGFEDRNGDKVSYISEAHAAASAAFIDSRTEMTPVERGRFWKKKKAVTVIDCGALTCDATTITVIGTDLKLRISEVCVSNGGNCGTTAIICRFLKALEDKFGAVFSAIPPEQLDRGTKFYEDCEAILRTYDGTPPRVKHSFSLKLPDGFTHDDYDADTREVYLHDAEIRRAFDENFKFIKAVVDDQWKKLGPNIVTDVIATGGGSLCPYIFNLLKALIEGLGAKCIRSPKCDSAVCRGALINAMNENFFGWRLCRAYFGIIVREEGRTRIMWFVVRGEHINVKAGITVKRCPGKFDLDNATIKDILRGVDRKPNGPIIYTFQEHLEDDQNPPDQPEDPGVEEVGRIVIDRSGFSKTLREKLEKALNKGEEFSIKTTVSLTVDGSGRLHFVAKSDKTLLGKGELRYDATEMDPQPPSW